MSAIRNEINHIIRKEELYRRQKSLECWYHEPTFGMTIQQCFENKSEQLDVVQLLTNELRYLQNIGNVDDPANLLAHVITLYKDLNMYYHLIVTSTVSSKETFDKNGLPIECHTIAKRSHSFTNICFDEFKKELETAIKTYDSSKDFYVNLFMPIIINNDGTYSFMYDLIVL